MFQGLNVQINVKIRPMEMVAVQQFHALEGRKTGVPQPWVSGKGKKILAPLDQHPKAIVEHPLHFNSRSARATL